MSLEKDLTFGGSSSDNELFQGTAFSQNNETFEDMQCFGFVWKNVPDYLLSWEWSACPPINHEPYPFPVLPSKPCNSGQQTYHPLEQRSFNSPLSLVRESGPPSAFTEASPFSKAFGLGILSGSDNPQPSDPVKSPSGLSTSQQVLDTSEPTAPTRESLPKSTQDHEDEPVGSGVLDASRTEVRRPKTNPSRERRREKNAKRSQLLPVTKGQQGRGRRKELDKDNGGDEVNILGRNRRAAARCRDRKRDLADALNSEMEELRDRHQQLSSCYNQLRSEVIQLKTEVLRHGDCGCDFIRRYISAEANRTVEMLTRHDHSPGGSGIWPIAT
ncbi:uncharacterized protein FOBCDRAFT_262754 [Fusarium oxysporum Fo47]|uniref:uncharacterized protein n=1 Tax=Fusarium oxysporum Fo47 TaxID=660027 RepID=UPI002869A226|nr:uncharacterized protein FOBCDRAFT_262754 [Fusarium oxysporum Fo47]WJG35838.1 hypothetical protein FOBCDRAFT_262754 [Fusarium oxysporum Fo47]